MDLLKTHKRRSRVSEAAYITLNVGLVVAIVVSITTTQAPWLALLFMIISKWRALAVRPRFWFANLVANMVDIVVGLSAVALLYATVNMPWLQLALAILYTGWLLLIKPRSSRKFVAIQAGVAVFLGITALSMVSYAWDSAFFVLCMWVIGYVSVRHVLGSYDEPHTPLYSLIGGFTFAEVGWIGFHWLMAYPLLGPIKLSQLALIASLFCLIAERAYASYHHHGSVRKQDVLLPICLTIGVMIVLFALALISGSDAL